ncbi:MAG TPA: tetratricopeptide repeat protein [Longimicrobiales bacterium]|nr:tetratricopeptide repeat protein [Longimicrobiales bacterium]
MGRFLTELRRRKVYQVTVVYVVLAVGTLEVLDILVPQTPLPDWSVRLFLVIAVAGLPVVLVLAWVYDITPGGVERTEAAGPADHDVPPTEPRARPSPADTAAQPGTLDPLTIAVLPFENLSGSDDARPLAVGLHDDLLTELSRASALQVISGTSVRAFESEGRSAMDTGAALGAGTVIEGTIQMAGRRVRLNIQMVDARTDAQRWAERFDRELSAENIFDLQVELATRIRRELQARLTSDEVARQPSLPTGDLEAYRLYVQGRRGLEAWGEDSIRAAVRDFRAALDHDRDYAAAWSGLADAVSLLDWYSYAPVPGAPMAARAVERALELDPDLAEAHVSKAIVQVAPGSGRDAPAALRSLERAVELRPSYAYAYAWMGWVHLVLGDAERGVEAEETSTRLDPLSPAARVFHAEALLAAGDGTAALREVRRGREIQPGRPLSHMFEGVILHHLGRFDDALVSFGRARDRIQPDGTSPTRAELLAFEAVTLAGTGRLEKVTPLLTDDDVAADTFCTGLIHAALGDAERALENFERVDPWGQLSTECLRYFYPEVLGSIRHAPGYPDLIGAMERSWGVA